MTAAEGRGNPSAATITVFDGHCAECGGDCAGHPQAVLPLAEGLVERAAETIAARYSHHTHTAYRGGWAKWTAWADGAGLDSMPAQPAGIVAYLQALHESGAKASTIAAARAAIAAGHAAAGYQRNENPAYHPRIADFMAGIRRGAGRQRQAAALLPIHLDAVAATARKPRRARGGMESPAAAAVRGAVDIAMVNILHDAALRISELAGEISRGRVVREPIRWRDISRADDGSGRLELARAKARGGEVVDSVYLSPACMRALERVRGAAGDPVIPLSASQVVRRLKAALTAAGYAGAGFSGHSGRVGLARAMSAAGSPDSIIARQAGWRDNRMVNRYTRAESAAAAAPYMRRAGDGAGPAEAPNPPDLPISG